MKKIKKLLVPNRSEIAIRIFRSAHELGIRTVAIYTHEDRYALHRFKADESYLIGQPGEPVKSYLDIDKIIELCLKHNVDAVHPGYGFLSENPTFAKKCEENEITFIGPSVDVLNRLSDKTAARSVAQSVNVPVLSGSDKAIQNLDEGKALAQTLGYPVILKAAHGGGGRGMRVVQKEEDFQPSFEQAQQESSTAFGSTDIFIEKFIQSARHIEVQILGDKHGNLVYLYERDCSIQRRHQKVIEIAPARNLSTEVRDALCQSAIRIGEYVGYTHAGTVEFLLDKDTQEFYFIEVNPRVQVEHTITEEVTGYDIVKSQILVAQGTPLNDPQIGIQSQDDVSTDGYSIQCRVTTEDPENGFVPDYGRIAHYRSASGLGIRLDAGSAFSGAIVNPFYDSLLVKICATSRRFEDAVSRMDRALSEFRIRGVKTNIPFLSNIIHHDTFMAGECNTRFIDQHPNLISTHHKQDRASKILNYIGETLINGNELVKDRPIATRREPAPVPAVPTSSTPDGYRQKLLELGASKFSEFIRNEKPLLLTDTSFRDAQQSLLATRVRSHDLIAISEAYAKLLPQLFSLEVWGGATFDTSMRFLKECPWDRLHQIREKVPNILLQMLIRSANTVGYTNYPDNVVKNFIKEAQSSGIDVFRVFDALNNVPNITIAMDAIIESGAICEATLCYTGDILDPSRDKYTLNYYVKMAKELEKKGAHILALKDMAGLCKPAAAKKLVKTLREEVGLPIHFHTHDTSGIQAASILDAGSVGLDIADVAMAPLSGGTAQPNLNTITEALRFGDRTPDINPDYSDQIAQYWRAARSFYTPFESPNLPATSDLYEHQMPGGQYTNLFQQATALGLKDQWPSVCKVYAQVNELFGDIVKVTPTSKAVGDMALFMVANNLTPEDILDRNRELAFPASVVDLLKGNMGQPMGGFPKEVQSIILKGEASLSDRPGLTLPSVDFEVAKKEASAKLGRDASDKETLSRILYPKVFDDFASHLSSFGDTSVLPTPVFFYGLLNNEETTIEIEPGKILFIRLVAIGDADPDGKRSVFFECNGQSRTVTITDQSLASGLQETLKAESANPLHLGAKMPGIIVDIAVRKGDIVQKGQKLLTLEAMKMESTLYAEKDGTIDQILVERGQQVMDGDLLITFS